MDNLAVYLLFYIVEKYVYTMFRLDQLFCDICPYCTVWPEAVNCCFTRATLFTNTLTCLFPRDYGIRLFPLSSIFDGPHILTVNKLL